MNQKYLFLSIDSYAHIKRNIFGFKNRKGVTEQRPCSLAAVSSSDWLLAVDGIYTAAFKGAKIKDDPDYVNRVIDPAYYGHPKAETDILHELDRLRKTLTHQTLYVVQDSARDIFKDFVNKNESAIGTLNEATVGYYSFMVEQMEKVPTTYFVAAMEKGSIEGYYNMNARQVSGSEEIDNPTKFELFQTHLRYPKFLPTDRALASSIKMNEAYTLLRSIVNKYK
jgi:hypothetical protein